MTPASMRILALVAFCSFGIGFGEANAQQSPETINAEERLIFLNKQVRRQGSVSKVREHLLEKFDSEDRDGGGLGESDFRLSAQKLIAQSRAKLLNRILVHDLDQDGLVTREELRRSLTPQARRPLRSAAGKIHPSPAQIEVAMQQLLEKQPFPDANNDGQVSFSEIMASDMTEGRLLRYSRIKEWNSAIPKAFDANGDGTVSRLEFTEALDEGLRRLDTDGDGSFSSAEAKAAADELSEVNTRSRQRHQMEAFRQKLRARYLSCNFPEVPKDADLVVLGIGEGQSLSTTSLGDDSVVTEVADIAVGEGARSLYVFALADKPIILRFSGEVHRVAKVVTSRNSQLGVTGLDRAQVEWLRGAVCDPKYWDILNKHRDLTASVIEEAVSRKPQRVMLFEDAGLISISDKKRRTRPALTGRIEPDLYGPSRPLWKQFAHHYPGGLVNVPADQVIAQAPARKYDLLPREAGLATLVEQDAIRIRRAPQMDKILPKNRDGTVTVNGMRFDGGGGRDTVILGDRAFKEDRRGEYRGGRIGVYAIQEKITLPAGLSGVHRAIFLLPKGLPEPDGVTKDTIIQRE
ncbi:MAG: hypothetical protein AAGL24_25295 [Pseudomonadota bacterium]